MFEICFWSGMGSAQMYVPRFPSINRPMNYHALDGPVFGCVMLIFFAFMASSMWWMFIDELKNLRKSEPNSPASMATTPRASPGHLPA